MAVPDRAEYPYTRDSEQGVLNKSQDSKYDVLAVELLVENDSETSLQRLKLSDLTGGGALAKKITVDGTSTYIATAQPGTVQSAASWQVQHIDESVAGTTLITWADGNANFDNVATDLTVLSYS